MARYTGRRVAILQMSDMRSQKDCEAFIRDFCDPCNPCERLVMVVDSKEVPHAVLNNVRQMLDAVGDQLQLAHQRAVLHALAVAAVWRGGDAGGPVGVARTPQPKTPPRTRDSGAESALGAEESKSGQEEGFGSTYVTVEAAVEGAGSLQHLSVAAASVPLARKHVVIVVHCPSSWLHVRRATYPSLPLQGWRFVYADAHSMGSTLVSARSWMAAACGLQHSLGDGLSEQSLRAANEYVLSRVVGSVTGNRKVALSDEELRELGDDARMEVFYRSPSTQVKSQQRLEALQDLRTVMGK
jgi:hypothetical protein